MTALHDELRDSAERPLQLQVRRDLVAVRQTYQGQHYWVVKDPLTLSFYRFEEEEYRILQLLDGKRSPAEIRRQFERQFAPQRLSLIEIQSLVSRLHQRSLVVANTPHQGTQLLQRRQRARLERLQTAWLNILCIRFPGINPDRFLQWLNCRVGWLFTRSAAFAAALLIISALLLVTARFDLFLRRLPDFQTFFHGSNWLLLAGVLAGTKVLHELGHGLACRRFGGQCHELGFMLLVLTPCLYCNVSDSWMVQSKWRRAAIGAAGMYVELILASLCTWLWWFSDVGLLHYLCLDVMFVCSVSTLLFNANPLLRYDGYFILSDLVEIPNLRQKSETMLRRKLGAWFLGVAAPDDPFLPRRQRLFFAVYAVLAWLYRWVIVTSILWFLYTVLAPHGLQVVGQLLVAVTLSGMLLPPIWQFSRLLTTPGRTRPLKKLRMISSLATVTGLAWFALCIPLPYHVATSLQLQPRDATTVYVDIDGTLVDLCVRPGQLVEAGQTLAVLRNETLELTLTQLRGQRAQLAAQLATRRIQAYDHDAALAEIAALEESIQSLDQRIGQRQQDYARLTIRAPRKGIVYAMPPRDARDRSETLPFWRGHPLQPENLHARLLEGVALCRIATPGALEAVLAVDESTVQEIRVGQSVEVFPAPLRGRHITGRIAQISQTDLHATPESVASAGRPQDDTEPARASSPLDSNTYQANVALNADHSTLLCGSRGRAKIDAGHRSLSRRAWNGLCRTFHFEL